MKFLVAVPVFNEAQYVARVLTEIRKYATDVLVINDGSTDSTPRILRRLADSGDIALITHPENRGYGQSLIDAFAYAHRHGYDWVLTMDCDEQHEPSKIPEFFAAARENDADIISGSRYLQIHAGDSAPPRDRQNINRMMTDLINGTLQLKLTDSFCGFKMHRAAAMDRMHLTIPGYAFPMQFWVQAARLHLKIRELPVQLIYNDPNRHFGGNLDDASVRLQHYLEVLVDEFKASREERPDAAALQECAGCCDA